MPIIIFIYYFFFKFFIIYFFHNFEQYIIFKIFTVMNCLSVEPRKKIAPIAPVRQIHHSSTDSVESDIIIADYIGQPSLNSPTPVQTRIQRNSLYSRNSDRSSITSYKSARSKSRSISSRSSSSAFNQTLSQENCLKIRI